jgi:hypothetical protein
MINRNMMKVYRDTSTYMYVYVVLAILFFLEPTHECRPKSLKGAQC